MNQAASSGDPGAMLFLMVIIIIVVCLMLVFQIFVLMKLYKKVRPDQAIVRSGGEGIKVYTGRGALVIPMLHEFVYISLNTYKLTVKRFDIDGLITADKKRANVEAEFYVKVGADNDSIIKASQAFAELNVNAQKQLEEMIEPKLIAAMFDLSEKQELAELLDSRKSFEENVLAHVQEKVRELGLVVESVNILNLYSN